MSGIIPLSSRGGTKRPHGLDGGGDREKAMHNIAETVRSILGDVDVSRVTSVNLDAYESFANVGRGLAIALSGRATVVQAQVASHLIEYSDPLKLIMPPEVAEDSRIVIKRKQVLGANAEIVPESAPARVVSVKEVEHEVLLQRYGGDIEMNTNLLAMPEEYAEDLNLKLSFQQNAMARRLSELGYAAALSEGQYLPNLLIRANPAMAMATPKNKAKANTVIYAQKCFAALQKYENAIPGLLAMAKKGSAAPFDTLILPAGVPEMETFTAAGAKFYLNGISDADKRMTFGMDNVKRDPVTGLNIGTYRGCVDYLDGQLHGQVTEGGLTRQVKFLIYNDDDDRIVDLKTNTTTELGQDTVRMVTAYVSSAILGVSGSGSMVVGYPTTSTFSQPTSPEKTMIQLRSYLGAYLRQPENVVVLPDVYFDGIEDVVEKDASEYIKGLFDGKDVVHFSEMGRSELDTLAGAFGVDLVDVSPAIYRGTTLDTNGDILNLNCGHLGALDSLDGAALFHGGVMMRPVVSTAVRGARGAGGAASKSASESPKVNPSGGGGNS